MERVAGRLTTLTSKYMRLADCLDNGMSTTLSTADRDQNSKRRVNAALATSAYFDGLSWGR
jgi:hypothetical protein